MKRAFLLFVFAVSSFVLTGAASATTWYVRPDGGTRYSSAMTSGQCNGQADAPYPGSGVNRPCAYGDVRWLWEDGSYAANDGTVNFTFPHWGWVIAGGDTVIVRGSLGTGVSYRIGWNNPSSAVDGATGLRFGLSGDPYSSNMPPVPSGTPSQPTRILGENYASCSAASAKTQLHGGYGVGVVLQMAGVSNVDVECMDITDWSSCGKAAQQTTCNKNVGSLSDFADTGVYWDNQSTNDTLNNVHIHGLAINGMEGSTGNGVVMTNIDVLGNAASGYNADAGNGQTGVGSLLIQNFNISWNGCAEEYPIVDALPYRDCTDDESGGYGDGFGTATVVSTSPWNVHFDQGVASYNTQDGLDALHLIGAGSSMTITRVLAYGNMGEQLKNGGSNGTLENNVIVGNCYAMQNAIPGTPAGFNKNLSDFCRAGNNGVLITTGRGANVTYRFNTLYSPNAIGVLLECDQTEGPCDTSSQVDFRDNIFLGFVGPYQSDFPTPIYLDGSSLPISPFGNAGSFNSNNVTFHPKSNWTCPTPWLAETNALCTDPNLADETYRAYGYNNATPNAGSLVIGTGVAIAGVSTDFNGNTRPTPPSRGAIDVAPIPATPPTLPSPPTPPTAPTVPTSPTPPATAPVSPTSGKIVPAPTRVSLVVTGGAAPKSPVVFQVSVTALTGSAVPSGSVTIFTKNGVALTKGTLDSNGSVTLQATSAPGNPAVYASYAGTPYFKSGSSPVVVISTATGWASE